MRAGGHRVPPQEGAICIWEEKFFPNAKNLRPSIGCSSLSFQEGGSWGAASGTASSSSRHGDVG